MSGIRSGMAAALAVLALPPAGALAVAPGESVGFTIPGSAVGDSYGVYVEGSQVASGVDNTAAPGFSGSYVMPNRGVYRRQVGVVIAVTGSDGTSRYYAHTVDYAPPVRPAPDPAPSTPAPRQAQPRPRADGGERQDSAAVLGAVRRSTGNTQKAAGRAARKAKPRRARKRRRPKLNQVARRPDPPAVHGRDVAAPGDPRRDLSGEEFPGVGYSVAWQLLAAVALTGLLLVALIAARSRNRRRLAEEETAMERELQELVAQLEERRALLR